MFLLLLLLVFGEQVVEAPDRGVGVLADHLDVGIAVAGREQQSWFKSCQGLRNFRGLRNRQCTRHQRAMLLPCSWLGVALQRTELSNVAVSATREQHENFY